MRGASSCDSVTCTPGSSSATSSASRRSWRGSTTDHNSEMRDGLDVVVPAARRWPAAAWSLVERLQHLAVGVDALAHADDARRGSSNGGFSQWVASVR